MAGGAGFGAIGLRRAWLPGWGGAPARLAEAVLALALLLGVAYVMGSVGAFRPWAVGGAVFAVGLVAWAPAHIWGTGRFARRPGPRRASAPVKPPAGKGALVAAVASACLFAQWWAFTAPALEHGMGNIDTLWYHAPFAARFVQEGWITRLAPTHPGLLPTFYPDNSELVHALAILPFHRDVLAPLLNLGWLVLAVLAGWCVGRPYGAPAGTLLAAAIPLGTPVLASTQPGNATNDVVVLALFMAALALVTNAEGERAPLALSCVAAGLAAGTKVTIVAPAFAVALCAPWLAARGARRSAAAWCALGVIVFGGFWYLRNAVRAGSPVPPVHLHLGPISFPTPAGLHTPPALDLTFAGLATRNHAWGSVILPGLHENLGVAWWAILGLAALGTLISL